jgi:hypothetical protein
LLVNKHQPYLNELHFKAQIAKLPKAIFVIIKLGDEAGTENCQPNTVTSIYKAQIQHSVT